jgi:glycosyltransferase involved in cell wall biosynthesis
MSIIADSHTWIAPTPQSTPIYVSPQLNRTNFPNQYIPSLHKITRVLKNIKPDFVHLHAQYHYSPAIILSGIQYILTSWGTEVLTLPKENIMIKILAKMAAAKASKVTVDANCLKEIWTRMGVPKSKVEVIPFGVDLKIFNPQVDGSEIRERLKLQNDDIVLISTRALRDHHYNVECFVKAIPLILKAYGKAKFIIKGSGPLEGYLRNLTKRLGISEYVRFVGLVPHAEMAKYLAVADIYVSTCFVDTTSVSLLEAMACELAPIVTDIPGNREWITNGTNGLLFPPKNPTALAEKAIQLIKNEDLRKGFGKKCFQIVKQKASWKDCVSKMERIYQSLL